MKASVIVGLIFLVEKTFCNKFVGEDFIRIDATDYVGDVNDILYLDTINLPPETSIRIEIDFEQEHKPFGFATLQVHSFHFNISLQNDQDKMFQLGSNLGVLVPHSNITKTFQLQNHNHDEVPCLLALIAFKVNSPLPGACSMEINSTLSVDIEETENLVVAKLPQARDFDSLTCDDESGLNYDTYYAYIDPLNFASYAYFEGIQRMLFDQIFSNYHTKKSPVPIYEFEKIPGRGLIINTVVTGKNGEISFYMPVVTYSCPQNSWSEHCSDVSFLKRALSVVLVMHSIVMVLNLLVPDLMEAIMNGMLVGGFVTIVFIKSYQLGIQGFDYFITIIIGAFFIAAIFGTAALYIPIGRYMSKLVFSLLLMAFVMEVFFETVTSVFIQFTIAFIVSLGFFCISMTFSVLLGGLIMIVSLSYLIKVGNLHRFLINNFLSLTTLPMYGKEDYFDFLRVNFINYKAPLNIMDYVLITFYIIGSIILTIRKEKYFFEHPSILDADHIFSESDVNSYNCNVARRRRNNCIVGIERRNGNCSRIVSRCRRHHIYRSNVINERSPLISHWLTSEEGDDEVFESPESNSRFIQTLSPETQERLSLVQNFDE